MHISSAVCRLETTINDFSGYFEIRRTILQADAGNKGRLSGRLSVSTPVRTPYSVNCPLRNCARPDEGVIGDARRNIALSIVPRILFLSLGNIKCFSFAAVFEIEEVSCDQR